MKITNSDIIQSGEQELIDAITADLDWGAIEDIFMKEHNLGIEEDIEYKRGDIVAHNDQIAYKLEFEVKILRFVRNACLQGKELKIDDVIDLLAKRVQSEKGSKTIRKVLKKRIDALIEKECLIYSGLGNGIIYYNRK